MERSKARPKFTVLIDTNILVSGLVFLEGNEHRILKLAEDKAITLVLPEFVLKEARAVLGRRFPGHEIFLDAFLLRADHTILPWSQIEQDTPIRRGEVRDPKDVAVLTSTILAKPHFAVTGDKTLREDMRRCHDARSTTICSSNEFLKKITKRP
ncbi:MAG: putative toxin-antitoxin system toxin component, PIN family [Candidatus Bathyarchaeia archaeon]